MTLETLIDLRAEGARRYRLISQAKGQSTFSFLSTFMSMAAVCTFVQTAVLNTTKSTMLRFEAWCFSCC